MNYLIHSHSSRRKGFALVVTLSLMVLLTVVGVGLLGLSAIALRQSTATRAQEEARANARLALMIAIGELQKAAGPDQRITAPASLAGTNPSPTMNRDRWLAVWHPGEAGADGKLNPALGWGRSGGNAAAKYYTDLRSQRALDWRSAWLHSTLVTNGGTDTGSTIQIGSNRDGAPVSVPLAKVASGHQGGTGAIAWWVEDLSQRASLAAGRSAQEAANHGLRAMPRANAGAIRDQSGWSTDFFSSPQARDMTVTLPTLTLANGGDWQGLDSAVGLRSWGLFADPVHGGLKADLTRFVESRQPALGRLPDMKLTGIDESASILNEPFHRHTGPKWGIIREWFAAGQQVAEGSSRPLASQVPARIRDTGPALFNPEGWVTDEINETKLPLHPVIVDAGFHWDFTPATAAHDTIRVHIYPRVVMWNPYNVPLQTSELLVLLNRDNDTRGGLTIEGARGTRVSVLPGWGREFLLPGENWDDRYTSYFTFTLEPTLFEPGGCLVFTPQTPANFLKPYRADVSTNILTARQPVGPNNFFIDMPLTAAKASSIRTMLTAERTVRRYIAQTNASNPWMNFKQVPFMLKAKPAGGAQAADVLRNPGFPSLQRLHINDRGTAFSWMNFQPGWNDTAANNGSPWRSFAEDPYRMPPRRWHFRVRMARADEADELASKGMPVNPAPPYEAAVFKDWNPLARTVCRTPSTYYQSDFDGYAGPWFLCVAPYDAHGPNQDWGWYDAASGLARGCPVGDPRNTKNREIIQYPMIDLLRKGQVLQSIGSLRHVPLSPFHWHPLSIVSNSRPSLHSDAERTVREALASESNPWEKIRAQTPPAGGQFAGDPAHLGYDDLIRLDQSDGETLLYDISFEVNRRLWDTHFASSWSPDKLWDGITRLPNQQYVRHPAVTDAARWLANSDAALSLWLPACLLANEGAFNVNSLSVDAWAAVLGGLRNVSRTASDGTPLTGGNPFARFGAPPADSKQWDGFLNLTDDQLRTLATRIVEVVRERGPFLGMADFVNRRLVPSTETGWTGGALDEALVRAGLADAAARGPQTRKNGGPASKVTPDLRAMEAHAADFRLDGNPDAIEQGDLLEPLAPGLTARGDTFRIRATGLAYHPDGRIASRQTCEAIVVRSPDYLAATPLDSPGSPAAGNSALEPPMLPAGSSNSGMIPNPNLHPLNRRFGRRFQIVDNKWIKSDI